MSSKVNLEYKAKLWATPTVSLHSSIQLKFSGLFLLVTKFKKQCPLCNHWWLYYLMCDV